MKYELRVASRIENIEKINDFVNEKLDQIKCPMKIKMQINIAIDEIFGNIAYYAYSPKVGQATIQMEINQNPLSVILTFIDSGIPFNPLQKESPDIKLSVEDRKIGGLGIHIVKKSMDKLSYQYKDNKNILTISKIINFD